METKMQQLPMTREVASAIWAKKCLDDSAWARQIQSDPAAAIGWDNDAQNVVTVQNTENTLNICVPDYRGLEDAVAQLSDGQMAGVSGGLFFLGLLGLIGTGAVVGATAAAGAGAAAAGGAMIAESQNAPDG